MENPKSQLTVSFPIEDVKQKFVAVVETGLGSYNFTDKNEVFSTYRFSIVEGLQVVIVAVSLRKIEDNTTEWTSEAMSASGNNVPYATRSRMQDEFLKILGKALSGEAVDRDLIKNNKSTGCMLVLALIALIFSSCLFFT